MTAQVSVFRRRDVIRAICDQLPAGATVEAIDSLAEEILSDRDVIRLIDLGENLTRFDERTVFSTRELLGLEQRILTTASHGQSSGRGQVPEVLLRIALADHDDLSDEQQLMVDRVCRSGHSVELVVGTPGSGKTRALAAAYAGWRKARFPVFGCSVKASAAAELETGSGIPSTTIARLLLDLDRLDPTTGQPLGLPAGIVLVVDEAGMLGTRHLARLLAHTQRAQGKLVLVGDPKQLPSIDAAGLFPLLADRLGATTLTGNRRQHDPADRDALTAYRDQDVAAALASYANRGRLHRHPTATIQREAMVAAWWTDQSQGIESVMLAYRRTDIRALNQSAHAQMLAAGRLAGPPFTVNDDELGERTFRAGDHVLLRRNDYTLGIRNGDIGTVTAVEPLQGNLTVSLNRGGPVTLPGHYVASSLDHGYALTIHASQGLTITRTHVLANDALFYEAGLVALSRHQDSCNLYLTDALDPSFEPDRQHGHEPKEHRDVALALQRSRADDAALAHRSRDGR